MRLLAALALATIGTPLLAQPAALKLGEQGYFASPGVNVLVFSNVPDGLFADAKISGVELIHQGERTATNGDVRLSATPGQWDPIGRLVRREVDTKNGVIEAMLEYPEHDFRYRVRAESRNDAVLLSVILDRPLPAALVGKAGFNLEFLPAAYFHRSLFADGKPGAFPLHPASDMVAGGPRNAASGRDIGPGAEPLPFARGRTLVLAPEDPARRVTITSATGELGLHDGRDQAQNGWFVVRGAIPAEQTGRVLEWTLKPHSVPGWTRTPVIGHSQLGYAPMQAKIAVIELDPAMASPPDSARLLEVTPDGALEPVLEGPAQPWGRYLRYDYRRFDFSRVRRTGLYVLEYGGQRTDTFRIAADLHHTAWHPTLDVYMPTAMDHMQVNEAYRIWHGDSHRDDARQAPVNHEHVDLYRQGPTTDTDFAPGEHIPGLNVGGWLDAGDFDIRTQTQYSTIRELALLWEAHRPARDQTLVDQALRRVEMHVPDGKPDILQQIAHGLLYLHSMYDAVGHAIHGVVEPDVAQYTHLGDAASKTDGLIFDASLAFGERRNGRSGTPDDRWAFTTRASALEFGTAAAMAAASRALRGHDEALADKSLARAQAIWAEEQSRPPFTYSHGNTTGGWLPGEEFDAAVELLVTTRDPRYAKRITALWPEIETRFAFYARSAVQALPYMPAEYRASVEKAARAWKAAAEASMKDNPYGVPITTGGWAGNRAVMQSGMTDHAVHRVFPDITDGQGVFRALDYLYGTHPGSNLSFVSSVGTRSKEVAYGMNRADVSFIAGGVVPGVLVLKPDFPENSETWPYFWGQNEYVINMGPLYISLVHAAVDLGRDAAKP